MLTEIWLQDDNSEAPKINEMTPDTHIFSHIPRQGKKGGGVGILIGFFVTKIVKKTNRIYETFEHLDNEMFYINRKIRLIVLYRPPNTSQRNFISELSSYLDEIGNVDQTYKCGDFNMWLEDGAKPVMKDFNELIDTYNLINGVSRPTSRSEHIMDLVIVIKGIW